MPFNAYNAYVIKSSLLSSNPGFNMGVATVLTSKLKILSTFSQAKKTYVMRGWDGGRNTFCEWASIDYAETNPAVTQPPLIGVLSNVSIVSVV